MKQEQFAVRPWPGKHQLSDYDCEITLMHKTHFFNHLKDDSGPGLGKFQLLNKSTDEFAHKKINKCVPKSLGQARAGPNPRAKS